MAGITTLALIFSVSSFISRDMPHTPLNALDRDLKARVGLPEAKNGQCFLIAPKRKRKIMFAAYPANFPRNLRLMLLFSDAKAEKEKLGEIPFLESAPCNNDALTPEKAVELVAQWRNAILNGPDLAAAREKLSPGREGILYTLKTRAP